MSNEMTKRSASPADKVIYTSANDGDPARFEDVPVIAFKCTIGMGAFGMASESTSVHLLRAPEDTERRLKKAEETTLVHNRPGNPVARIEGNNVAAEMLGEDRLAIDVIPKLDISFLLDLRAGHSLWDAWADLKAEWKKRGGDGTNDMVLLSVHDGHGGSPAVSELLRKTFHACLTWAITQAEAKAANNKPGTGADQPSLAEEAMSAIYGDAGNVRNNRQNMMMDAIRQAYLAWDHDILAAPMHFLDGKIALPDNPHLPGFPNPALAVLADTAIRGAASATVIVDAQSKTLYVSHVGDCRVVAGWWDTKAQKWCCEVLTNDHRGENAREAERRRAKHPKEEREDVLVDQGNGIRVLGSSQPMRSFGGSTYKLPVDGSARLERVLGAHRQKTDRPVKTPPYKSAIPDIIARPLHPPNGRKLKFLILASDGLWDSLTSEEAVLLVAAHLDHSHHDPIRKGDLPRQFPLFPPSIPRRHPAEPVPGAQGRSEGSWVFMDDHAATHLIRNSLGSRGWDDDTRQRILSMQDGWAKSMRDDQGVLVATFEDEVND